MIPAFLKRSFRSDPGTVLSPEQEAEFEISLGDIPLIGADLLDRSAIVVTQLLSEARAQIDRLDVEIAERQELRRQASLVVEHFAPLLAKLDDGYDPADDPKPILSPEPNRRASEAQLQAAE